MSRGQRLDDTRNDLTGTMWEQDAIRGLLAIILEQAIRIHRKVDERRVALNALVQERFDSVPSAAE